MTLGVVGLRGAYIRMAVIKSSYSKLYKFVDGKRVVALKPIHCLVCDTEFQPRESRSKYCSMPCYWKMKRIRGDRVHLTLDARRRIGEAVRKRNTGKEGWSRGKKRPEITAENSRLWKGGRYIVNGYVYLSNSGREVREHRHIMEIELGRKLKSSEIVHHINHNKLDNRLENLMVVTRAEHVRLHNRWNTKN